MLLTKKILLKAFAMKYLLTYYLLYVECQMSSETLQMAQ